ncbi:LIM-domain binding protein-domain-containing protein [Epithele typhae]|uniref:LIM-domain binding protein-domain-containing protein n=1 Tax=Epithele typhae TaxID=378194 RepID=UPI002008074D|nr:LIM-domain binding protein-domain-containing protein [Epithele typhae]KAH9942987.1 LIM-domain binding protein-domain-containing protein [Epithele typhae]
MGAPSFLPQQPQQGQHQSQHNLSMLQNNQGANPGLGFNVMAQPGVSPAQYPLGMQQSGQPRRFLPPHSNPPGAGPSHMGGMPNQMQNMAGFPSNQMMPQQTLRRVQSQPMSQPGAHIPGMQPGMMGGGMGMNGQQQMGGMRPGMQPGMTSMQMQMRQQQQQQQHQQHQQHQQQSQMQGGGMGQDVGMPMNRMQGANPLAHTRTASNPSMIPGMTQPPTHPQQHGMQQGMPHNSFVNPMSLPPQHQHQHQHQHPQGQMGSSPHAPPGQQQPSMGGPIPGNSMMPQGAGNRASMTPDNAMFNFSNAQMQPSLPQHVNRMVPSMSNNFNIAPSPTPLNPGQDMTQRGSAPMNPAGPMTPAQALDHLNHSGEGYPTSAFGMSQQSNSAPPRPPSHNGHGPHGNFPMPPQPSHPPQQSPRQSAHPSTPMQPGHTLQRPQSQSAHRQSPIPPLAPNRTPRMSQTSLPTNASAGSMLPPARVPTTGPAQSPPGPSQPPGQPPASAPPSVHPAQIAPRPSTATPMTAPANVPSTAPAPTLSSAPQTTHPSHSPQRPQQPAPLPITPSSALPPSSNPWNDECYCPRLYPIGLGQGMARMSQLSNYLSQESNDRLKEGFWLEFVQSFFVEKAAMKLTLWKDNQHVEAKPFEIGYPIFARFFLVTSQSGVRSQSLAIDGARERLVSDDRALIECPMALWTFRYTNGYSITLRGPFSAEIVVSPNLSRPRSANGNTASDYYLKVERMQFDAFWHDKYLAYDAIIGDRIPDSPRMITPSPNGMANANGAVHEDPSRMEEPRYIIERASIPTEPINAFGIPQATMRCLELAESVAQMTDLIQFSCTHKMGPVEALGAFAERLRMERIRNPSMMMESAPRPTYSSDGLNDMAGPTPGPSTTTPAMGPSQPLGGSPMAIDGSKQSKGTPAASASTPVASASTPASAPTPGGPTTPSIANATLKRKAPAGGRTGEDSPTATVGDSAPAAKRPNRKRGKTQGS